MHSADRARGLEFKRGPFFSSGGILLRISGAAAVGILMKT